MTQLIIDADTHLTEPPDVWTARVPGKWLDEVPHVVRNDEGRDVWVLDGTPFSSPGLTAVAGWPEPFPAGPKTYEECHARGVRRRRAARATWTRWGSGRRCSTRTSPASAASASSRSATTS